LEENLEKIFGDFFFFFFSSILQMWTVSTFLGDSKSLMKEKYLPQNKILNSPKTKILVNLPEENLRVIFHQIERFFEISE